MARRGSLQAYPHEDPRPGCTVLPFAYFRMARELPMVMDSEDDQAFPALIFAVSAVEAFINENLNTTLFSHAMYKSINHDKIQLCLQMYTSREEIDTNFSQTSFTSSVSGTRFMRQFRNQRPRVFGQRRRPARTPCQDPLVTS